MFMKMFLFYGLWILASGVSGRGLIVDPFVKPSITLYPDSHVVNILDTNTSALYNSESLWMVQFYSHWCGHCQRFAPFWISLAEDIKDWSPVVRVAAMNCAEQSCDRYQIRGTPTVRVFHPHTIPNRMDSSYYGFDVPVKHDLDFFKATLLYNMAASSPPGKEMAGNTIALSALRSVPEPTPESLATLFSTLPDTAEYVALVFEQEFMDSVGKEVIMDMSRHRKDLPVLRVDSSLPGSRDWGLTVIPTLVVVDREGDQVMRVEGWGIPAQDRIRFRQILDSFVNGTEGVTASPEPGFGEPDSTESPDEGHTTDSPPEPTRDEVFLGDLEKAVQYSITREVAMQPVLDQQKLSALVFYLEALLAYLPGLREPTRKFLISLRDWPVQMGYTSITHTAYKNKVEELSALHHPWGGTPEAWTGCAGTNSQYRGYPCSLWTLFHTLTVSAGAEDPAFVYGGVSTVAKAMIGYIAQFFSCRECAQHFSSHVSSLGFLPTTADQSIIWLWTIHNKANLALAGDSTEDPSHPKIQWPSPSNCPACREFRDRWTPLTRINGELWSQADVIEYLKSVYSEENLINNVDKEKSSSEVIEEAFEELRNATSPPHWSEEALKKARLKIVEYCVNP